MRHYIYPDKFLCYDWNIIALSKPRDYTASCLLDKSRSFTVYVPRAYNDDISKPYAELRYNSEEKGKGNDVAILLKECQELADLMTKNYGKGTDIGKQVEHYRTLFYALPEKQTSSHTGRRQILASPLFTITTMSTSAMNTITSMPSRF